MKYFYLPVVLSCICLSGYFGLAAAQEATPNTATTDCAARYPGTSNNDVSLREVCEKNKKELANPEELKSALENLDTTREGVYGCNGIGKYGPVGLKHASLFGGTYVPVSEAAVALNTFILVNNKRGRATG
jgi:hypothetical protein